MSTSTQPWTTTIAPRHSRRQLTEPWNLEARRMLLRQCCRPLSSAARAKRRLTDWRSPIAWSRRLGKSSGFDLKSQITLQVRSRLNCCRHPAHQRHLMMPARRSRSYATVKPERGMLTFKDPLFAVRCSYATILEWRYQRCSSECILRFRIMFLR